jgi:hypothetical protein
MCSQRDGRSFVFATFPSCSYAFASLCNLSSRGLKVAGPRLSYSPECVE